MIAEREQGIFGTWLVYLTNSCARCKRISAQAKKIPRARARHFFPSPFLRDCFERIFAVRTTHFPRRHNHRCAARQSIAALTDGFTQRDTDISGIDIDNAAPGEDARESLRNDVARYFGGVSFKLIPPRERFVRYRKARALFARSAETMYLTKLISRGKNCAHTMSGRTSAVCAIRTTTAALIIGGYQHGKKGEAGKARKKKETTRMCAARHYVTSRVDGRIDFTRRRN